LQDQYREYGHTPNFHAILKDVNEKISSCDSKLLYDLFSLGTAKKGARSAALPKPFGNGGF